MSVCKRRKQFTDPAFKKKVEYIVVSQALRPRLQRR